MKQIERFLVRHNLGAYAEIMFARYLLAEKEFVPYFPFKDVGVDTIGLKKNLVERYQIKAANERPGDLGKYWFSIKDNMPKMERLSKLNGHTYFILCALQLDQEKFHFFKIPVAEVTRYFEAKTKTQSDYEIKRITNDKYEVWPKKIGKEFNVNQFRLT